MMIEPILGVTRVKSIGRYNADEQHSREAFKRKPTVSFQDVLSNKLKAEQPADAYQVKLNKTFL